MSCRLSHGVVEARGVLSDPKSKGEEILEFPKGSSEFEDDSSESGPISKDDKNR